MHSEGVYKGLYPAFGARKRRLGLCVFASVLCVNLILFSFSILSFAFFLTSIQLVCSRLRFCFSVSLFYFEEKVLRDGWGVGGGGGGGSTAETSGGEGVLVFGLGGWKVVYFSP